MEQARTKWLSQILEDIKKRDMSWQEFVPLVPKNPKWKVQVCPNFTPPPLPGVCLNRT